jgi:putative tricarboxylic transport membrane protein
VAAIGSFFAGTIATLLIAVAAPALVNVSQSFSSVEYCSLIIVGLIAAVVLSKGSLLQSMSMVLIGISFGLFGIDPQSGIIRYSFNSPELFDGLEFAAIAMGLFGFAEVVRNLEKPINGRSIMSDKLGGIFPSFQTIAKAFPSMIRGTVIGSVLGVLPGGGATIGAFAAYSVEKKLAKDSSRFGQGAFEGVAAPEAANNAGAQTSFIPLLSLGIPANGVIALMMGAMIMQGIVPGPNVMTDHPRLFWGLIVSMWVGNLMLLVINLPLIGIWVRMLSLPYRVLFPAILLFCCIGVYSIDNSTFQIGVAAVVGLIGYVLHRLNFEAVPLLLGFVLGPLFEDNLRRSLVVSHGSYQVLLERPLSAVLLVIAVALLSAVLLPQLKNRRQEVFAEEES